MATQAQIDANRRNAQLSTGPTSPPGKCSSRANSTRHGLSGAGVVVDAGHRAEALDRKARWDAEIRPADLTGQFALDRMVAMSLRIEQCENALDALFVEEADRAARDWDHTCEVEATAAARGLAKDPAAVAGRLAGTKQGVELMLGRWGHLARSLEIGGWDESDRSIALDLMGVEPAFRKPGQTALDAPEDADATGRIRGVIDREVARLRGRLAAILGTSDDLARRQAESSLTVLRSKPAALILRYEREATRRFHAAMKAAYAGPRDDSPTTFDPGPYRGPVPRPEPAIPPAEPAPAEAPSGPEDHLAMFEAMLRDPSWAERLGPFAGRSPSPSPDCEPARPRPPAPAEGPKLVTALAGGLLDARPNRHDRRAEAARLRRD